MVVAADPDNARIPVIGGDLNVEDVHVAVVVHVDDASKVAPATYGPAGKAAGAAAAAAGTQLAEHQGQGDQLSDAHGCPPVLSTEQGAINRCGGLCAQAMDCQQVLPPEPGS